MPSSSAPPRAIDWSTSAAPTALSSTANRSATLLLQAGDQIQIGQTILVYSGGGRESSGEQRTRRDLADHISLITRQDIELPSAIIKTIGETEGSRILAQPEQIEGPWLKNALANLMYEAIQAVSHILDLDQLLDRILELIFRLVDADRGCSCCATRHGGAEAEPPCWTAPSSSPRRCAGATAINRQEKIPVSRTIMDHVLREKQGVLVSDAARDERFQRCRASCATASARSSACR